MEKEVKKKTTTDMNRAKCINQKLDVKKRKKKKWSYLVPVMCLIMGILLGIIGALLLKEKSNEKENTNHADFEVTEEQSTTAKNTVDEMLENKSFKIKTKYGELYYPIKWQDQVRIEQVEGEVYKVQFFATIEGKEELHIFDVSFAGEEGSLLGYLEGENGEKVSVSIISQELEFDKEWTEDEKSVIYTMLEDINYIIGKLQKEAGFEAV